MIAKIIIKGQIGSTESEKGVELQDVISQVEANKDAVSYQFHIDSNGGSVRVGKLIADYIKGLPNAITIADGLCASIATEIHLARPVSQRKILAGTNYFIHSPLMVGVDGNSDELAEMSSYIKGIEKTMVQMYHLATGLDKAAITGLMKQETSLTPEQAVELGFAGEVLQNPALKAVAFLDKEIINKPNKMKKLTLKEKLVAAMAAIVDAEPNSMVVVTDNGELTYASEGEMPVVGEEVMIGEEVAADGTYTTEGGFGIVVVDGVVSEIIEPETVDVEALKAEISELTAKLEASQAETVEANAKVEAAEAEAIKTAEEEIKAFKATIESEYEPKAKKKEQLNGKSKNLSMKEKAAARKAELKK